MTDLQREKELAFRIEQNVQLWPDDGRYLLTELKEAREKLEEVEGWVKDAGTVVMTHRIWFQKYLPGLKRILGGD